MDKLDIKFFSTLNKAFKKFIDPLNTLIKNVRNKSINEHGITILRKDLKKEYLQIKNLFDDLAFFIKKQSFKNTFRNC